jgi:hypothetical protein
VRRTAGRQLYARALAWGTVVALASAVLTGMLRVWIWIPVLEPLAIGVLVGEAAAVPSSVPHRRPPGWSYAYVFAVGLASYLLVFVAFWLAGTGFALDRSFLEFLRGVPSTTAAPLFRGLDVARRLALATGGATALKYWLWALEGLLLGGAAALAYRGGSVRRLKT